MLLLSFSATAKYEILKPFDYGYDNSKANTKISPKDKSSNPGNGTPPDSNVEPNKDPIANNDSELVTYEGKTLENIDVLDNDKDPDGDPIRVDSASANNGSATINPDGTIKYKPNPGFNGSDKIVYKITDDKGGSDEANVLINVESEIAAAVKENEDKSQSQFDETVKLIEGESKKFGCEYIYQKYIVEKKIPISYPPTHNWNEPSKFDIKEYEEIFRTCK